MVRTFIKALGGPTQLAPELNKLGADVQANTIESWCGRNSIPAKYRPKVARVAIRHGVELISELEEFVPARRRRAS